MTDPMELHMVLRASKARLADWLGQYGGFIYPDRASLMRLPKDELRNMVTSIMREMKIEGREVPDV